MNQPPDESAENGIASNSDRDRHDKGERDPGRVPERADGVPNSENSLRKHDFR